MVLVFFSLKAPKVAPFRSESFFLPKINFCVAAGDSIQAGQLVATIGGGAGAAPAPAAEAAAESAPAAASGNGSAINAPVAGTLLKNLLSEGAAVKAGQGLRGCLCLHRAPIR